MFQHMSSVAVLLLAVAFATPGHAAPALASPANAARYDRVAALAGGRHAAPDLEAVLPTTLGGVALTVESQRGTELSTTSTVFDTFLQDLGKTRADFWLASAYSPGGLKAEVGAWRVQGADPLQLLAGFQKAVQASSTTPLTTAEETLAGRKVTRIGDLGQLTQGPLHVFAHGDTLLFVQTPDRALAEEAIGKLPKD